MAKDDRMHGVIRKRALQDVIKTRMKLEDITFEELIEQYLTFPEDAEDLMYKEYTAIEAKLVHAYEKPKLRELMDTLWVLIIRSAKGDFEIEKILHNLRSDLSLQTYKKR